MTRATAEQNLQAALADAAELERAGRFDEADAALAVAEEIETMLREAKTCGN